MKNPKTWQRPVMALIIGIVFLFGGFILVTSEGVAMQETKGSKKNEHIKAFALYQAKCLGCHDSIADPEKPGRTRDDWHLVVEIMHKYGFDLTEQESEMIIELLYDLRKGMEREAG